MGHGQTGNDSIPLDRDTELSERRLPDNLNEKYQGDEFNYDVKTGEAQNLLARFFNWLGRILRNTFGIDIPPGAFKVMEILVYILMGGLVIYLLVRVFINEKFNSIFTKKAKSIKAINLSEQHIETKPDLKARFKEVAYIYDYIWYGEQEVDNTMYDSANNLFGVLSNRLNE